MTPPTQSSLTQAHELATNTDTTGFSESPSPAEVDPALISDITTKLETILGADGLKKVQDATVMVLGVGGVGSNCIEALARGGVGKLIIVDHDTVSASNINRQAVAYVSTIGQKKVEVMKNLIRDINPSISVITRDDFILESNLADIIAPYKDEIDYLVDAIDTISTKLAIGVYAQTAPFPVISSMGAANKLHPECFGVSDLFDTIHCPICKIMRKEGRKRGIKRLKVVYSYEKPLHKQVEEGHTRREKAHLGTASFVPPIIGQMIAGEVIKSLSGISTDGYISATEAEKIKRSVKTYTQAKKKQKRA